MRVLVDTVSVLGRERVVELILGGEGIVALVDALISVLHCYLLDVEGVLVLLDQASLGGLAVVNTGLDFLLHQAHFGHDTLHADILVDEVRLETSGGDEVFPNVTLDVDVVSRSFFGEVGIGLGGLFFGALGLGVAFYLINNPV